MLGNFHAKEMQKVSFQKCFVKVGLLFCSICVIIVLNSHVHSNTTTKPISQPSTLLVSDVDTFNHPNSHTHDSAHVPKFVGTFKVVNLYWCDTF